jgi:hypothetical protein
VVYVGGCIVEKRAEEVSGFGKRGEGDRKEKRRNRR